MYYAQSPWGKAFYAFRLEPLIENNLVLNNKFQWVIRLDHLIEPEPTREATNRPWHFVGPVFETREKGSSYLGWKDGQVDHHSKVDVKKHIDEMATEYNKAYPSPPEFQKPYLATTPEDVQRGFIEHSRISDLSK